VKAIGKAEVGGYIDRLLRKPELPYLWIENWATDIVDFHQPGGYVMVRTFSLLALSSIHLLI
jgi:hypothetical protein